MENYFDTKKNIGYINGQVYYDHNKWREDMKRYGAPVAERQGGSYMGYPSFNFDWSAAEREAIEKLKPYYEKKLEEAQGDMDRAKQLLEEDYQTGVRRTDEDLARTQRVLGEDKTAQLAGDTLTKDEELRDIKGALNQKGVLMGQAPSWQSGGMAPYSDYAQTWFLNPLDERQQLRRQAIERAIDRQAEIAGIDAARAKEDFLRDRDRAVQEYDIKFPRYKRELEEEKKQKAITQMAPLKYEQEYQKYQNLLNSYQ